MNGSVKLCIVPFGQIFNIISSIISWKSLPFQTVSSLVIGDGGFLLGRIAADNIIPPDMDAGRKNAPPVMKPPGYAAVAVDDLDIAVTVIERIAVDKTKVTARNSMGADAGTSALVF